MLVVGGAGVFGSRLVGGILRTSDLHVVVAGRGRGPSAAPGVGEGEGFRPRL